MPASPFIALIPAVAALVFGGGTQETAILLTAQGIGAVAAAVVVMPLVDRLGRSTELLIALVALPLALGCYARVPTFPLAVACLALVGAAYLAVFSGLNTVIQVRAPSELRGRALSLFSVALGSTYPLGAIAQGAMGYRVGLRPTTLVTAGLLLAIVLVLRWRRPDLMRALGQGPVGDPATRGRALE